jgi:CRISPR-associated protein Cas2
MDILVIYDINTASPADARRLARIAAVCERYGQRAQYSLFQCRFSENRFLRLVADLEALSLEILEEDDRWRRPHTPDTS